MASMYACYHGPQGLMNIAKDIHQQTKTLHHHLKENGYKVLNDNFFDTLTIAVNAAQKEVILSNCAKKKINLFLSGNHISISLDESVSPEDLADLLEVFESNGGSGHSNGVPYGIPSELNRKAAYLDHPVFHKHHTETQMMRYIKSLENKDPVSYTHLTLPTKA